MLGGRRGVRRLDNDERTVDHGRGHDDVYYFGSYDDERGDYHDHVG
ncbi:MAG: hypothetical protein GY925_04125 [Actinomycetia bacterium]|nr:hypothetical protein [Actinomycetes bacterium]